MVRDGKPSDARCGFMSTRRSRSTTPEGAIAVGPPLVPVELFTVPEGLEVTLWATSPLLFNPTNIDFDAQGRLYVAEGVNYRGKANRRPEGDRIVVLEDTTGSGKADKSTVFVQERESRRAARRRGARQQGRRLAAAGPARLHGCESRRHIRSRGGHSARCCSPASTGASTITACTASPRARTACGISTRATPARSSPTNRARPSAWAALT